MAYLRSGKLYYIRYKNWKTDPIPYLFTIWHDKRYTSGFNIHYLAYARFGHDIPTTYRRMSDAQWEEMFTNLRGLGLYKNFFKYVDNITKHEMGRGVVLMHMKVIKRRWPWTMKTYRLYHTNKIILKKEMPFSL